jgi:arginine decarboxylase
MGTHETQRAAMQRAMRQAGVSDCNFVKVSSVIPPGCEIITRERGLRMLRAGGIVHAVIAEGETSEPYQRITPAICWAQPDDPELPGYMTEIEEGSRAGAQHAVGDRRSRRGTHHHHRREARRAR